VQGVRFGGLKSDQFHLARRQDRGSSVTALGVGSWVRGPRTGHDGGPRPWPRSRDGPPPPPPRDDWAVRGAAASCVLRLACCLHFPNNNIPPLLLLLLLLLLLFLVTRPPRARLPLPFGCWGRWEPKPPSRSVLVLALPRWVFREQPGVTRRLPLEAAAPNSQLPNSSRGFRGEPSPRPAQGRQSCSPARQTKERAVTEYVCFGHSRNSKRA
jgi:hypothetical protein